MWPWWLAWQAAGNQVLPWGVVASLGAMVITCGMILLLARWVDAPCQHRRNRSGLIIHYHVWSAVGRRRVRRARTSWRRKVSMPMEALRV
jgi:hypothetical protein